MLRPNFDSKYVIKTVVCARPVRLSELIASSSDIQERRSPDFHPAELGLRSCVAARLLLKMLFQAGHRA